MLAEIFALRLEALRRAQEQVDNGEKPAALPFQASLFLNVGEVPTKAGHLFEVTRSSAAD